MKLVIEVPDSTLVVALNYVYTTDTGMSIGSRMLDTEDIKAAKVKEDAE